MSAPAPSARFFPHNFFNDNLATLHELNRWFPWIMLVYIATITMGIWSEERRQGTDELLLTVPADDWDIVLGKYLAAVAIYTVSLLFSQVTNFLVIAFLSLGDVDLGLFATTYLGYWVVGLAMIAVAMVGSFLTRNQTVGFIFGVLLNLPLVLSSYADAVLGNQFALRVAQFSYAEQFFDFGRGVISLRALVFFGMLIAIGLYLSVVLVGRRHWVGSKDGHSMLGHYAVRTVCAGPDCAGLDLLLRQPRPFPAGRHQPADQQVVAGYEPVDSRPGDEEPDRRGSVHQPPDPGGLRQDEGGPDLEAERTESARRQPGGRQDL